METTTHTTTETHNTPNNGQNPARKAAVNALAIVGFLVLIVLGIILAIYSSRFIPDAVNKLSVKNPTPNQSGSAQLAVVSSTTLPFSQSTSTVMTAPAATTSPAVTTTTSVAPTTETAPAKPALYGLPNLTTTIIATGYLANGTTESFVPAAVIPPGARAAVRFSIANTGTNVTGPWQFNAVIPTQHGYVFTGPIEQSLAPGDHIVFTLGFDQADLGPANPITITADPMDRVAETTKADNSRTTTIAVP